MDFQQIALCERRIAEEELLSEAAGSPEDAAAHAQLAMLYRAQLRSLLRLRPTAAPDLLPRLEVELGGCLA